MSLYYCTAMVITFVLIVVSGMKANRQLGLHATALTHYRTRLEAFDAARLAELNETDGSKEEISALQHLNKRRLRALKFVISEIEKESDCEQLRIMGFKVNSRMLEALFGLASGVALTMWQAFTG